MIALQEELDWDIYRRYRLITDEEAVGLVAEPGSVPDLLILGFGRLRLYSRGRWRAASLRQQWFARHRSTPVTEIPQVWPRSTGRSWLTRIEMIERNRNIRPDRAARVQATLAVRAVGGEGAVRAHGLAA